MIVPDRQSDLISLFESAKAGDRAALGRLTEACRPYLLRIANEELDPRLRVKCAASDIVQETLLEGQRAFAAFGGGSEGELLVWMRRILRNNLTDQARRYLAAAARDVRKEQSLDGEHGAVLRDGLHQGLTSPLDALLGLERRAAVELCLQRLPEEYRRAIQMRHLDEKSFEQIGHALGKSAEAARKVWFRALTRLRQEIRSHEELGPSTG